VGAVENLRGTVAKPLEKSESTKGSLRRRITKVNHDSVVTLNESILIIGSTTNTGSKVTLHLLDQLAKEVVIAEPPLTGKISNFIQKGAILREYEINEPNSIESIYKNIDIVVLTITFDMFPIIDRMIAPLENFKDKIKMVILSIRGGIFSRNKETRLGTLCIDLENKIKSLDIPYIIIRHSLEFEYLNYFNSNTNNIEAVRTIPVNQINWVSAHDIAICIVNVIYKRDVYNKKTFEITATSTLGSEEVSDCISNSLRKVVPVLVIEEEEFKDIIQAFGYSEEKCEYLIEEYQHFQNFDTTNDIMELLQNNPEDFQKWCDKNSHIFMNL